MVPQILPQPQNLMRLFGVANTQPGTLSDRTVNGPFPDLPIEECPVIIIEDFERGDRQNWVFVNTSDGSARFETVRDMWPTSWGYTMLDMWKIVREMKSTKNGVLPHSARLSPGRYGEDWIKHGLLQTANLIIIKYMHTFERSRRERSHQSWRRSQRPEGEAFAKTRLVPQSEFMNTLNSLWDSWTKMGLNAQQVKAGMRRPIYLGAHAWNMEQEFDWKLRRFWYTKAEIVFDCQRYMPYSRHFGRNMMKLSLLCQSLGVNIHDADGNEIAHSPGADTALSMRCILAIHFAAPAEYSDYLAGKPLSRRVPTHDEDTLLRNRRAFEAIMPPRQRRVPNVCHGCARPGAGVPIRQGLVKKSRSRAVHPQGLPSELAGPRIRRISTLQTAYQAAWSGTSDHKTRSQPDSSRSTATGSSSNTRCVPSNSAPPHLRPRPPPKDWVPLTCAATNVNLCVLFTHN